jgi:Amt family ammonium transporter
MVAIYNTQLAASTGVIGWTMFGYIRHGRKFSVIGACEGAIAGLVGITPAAGYVSIWCAAAIGFITAIVICCFENVNEWLRIDDGLEVFKLHGIGGMCGAFLTGIFATSSVSSLDGVTLAPGAIDGNGVQVGKQLAEICAIASYSFVCSALMLLIMKYIPGLHLRVTDEIEMIGYDADQFYDETIGEWALFESEQADPGEVTHGMHVHHDASSSTTAPPEKVDVAPAKV